MIFVLAALSAAAFLWHQNNGLVVSRYSLHSDRLPEEFRGYTILHLSDLHNKSFGRGQRRLMDKIIAASPDMIVISGDIVDSRRYDLEPALELVERAAALAPVYYVSGNHECSRGRYRDTISAIEAAGAVVMDNRAVEIHYAGRSINLAGMSDYALQGGGIQAAQRDMVSQAAGGGFTLLLSHRPEFLEAYAATGADVVFSGHAHGGQFRIPGLGGLFAPGQGLFPRYTSGVHSSGSTSMVVSRGLGNSVFPLRLFNRPEIVAVELG